MAEIITPEDASTYTGKTVEAEDIATAQSLIEIYIDRDFSDEEWYGGLSERDQKRLTHAVAIEGAHQHDVAAGTGSFNMANLPAGVTSVSQGDVSLSFGAGSSGGSSTTGSVESLLSSLTLRLLGALSWRSTKTIKPQSMYDEYYGPGRVFTTETAFYGNVVRSPLPDAAYWTEI